MLWQLAKKKNRDKQEPEPCIKSDHEKREDCESSNNSHAQELHFILPDMC